MAIIKFSLTDRGGVGSGHTPELSQNHSSPRFVVDISGRRGKPGTPSTEAFVSPDFSRQHAVIRAGVLLVIVALIANMVGCSLPPIPIRDWYDLDAIRNNLRGRYRLVNDLDSTTAGYAVVAGYTANSRKGWQPIGTSTAPFTGSFDAQGYEIQELFINRPDEDWVGLFGFVGQTGIVNNVELVDAVVRGRQYVGGIAGASAGSLVDCCFSGRVTGDGYCGALVGANTGTVINSHYNYNDVLVNGERMITIGALPGEEFVQWLANGKFLDVSKRLSRENGYYLVSNVSDLRNLLAFGQDSSLRFRLTRDLNLAHEDNFYIPYMAGEFDGNGHRILNFSFQSNSTSQVGLFGYLAVGAEITGLGVENLEVAGAHLVGGLVGLNDGAVSNCYAGGNVVGDDYVGGLIGHNKKGVVNNCHSTGSVYGRWNMGGLVGVNEATVTNSYSANRVSGWYSVGGLTGINMGSITNSYSSGSVAAWESVGGLAGLNKGSLGNSYSTASVDGWYCVGGLIGVSWAAVTNSYALGSVTGRSTVGGLIGSSYGSMRECHVGGEVSGERTVGGLVGSNYGTVRKSYATDGVNGEWNVGGLVGNNYGTVNDCYFEGETRGNYCVGGLMGDNDGTASNCRSTGGVSGKSYVGGFAGSNSGTVTTSYSTGSVMGSSVVSSFVAINNRDGTISNSYSIGSVVGDHYVAGLIGVNFGIVIDSYSAGNVTGHDYVGGLLGVNWGGSVVDSFWDTESTGQAASAAGTAKTTAEMRSVVTFLQAGWNIGAVSPGMTNPAFTWNIVNGQTYPFLSGQSAD